MRAMRRHSCFEHMRRRRLRSPRSRCALQVNTKSQAQRMNTQTHSQRAGFIWSICNLLRGPYTRNEYLKTD
jgi:hypothetical protein